MNRKTLTAGFLAAVVVFVTLAAIVLSPGVLQPQSSTPDSGNGGDTGNDNGGNGGDNGDGGTTPQEPVPIETPAWNVGDSWTYNVTSSSSEPSEYSDRSFGVAGEFTRTVTAIEGDAYNVSVTGTFRIEGFDLMQDSLLGNASIMVLTNVSLNQATVEGYSLYRTSDLAKLRDIRTIHLSGAIETEAGDYNLSYTKTIETTYDPAFDVWDFPLDENETWEAVTNATVRVWTEWAIEGPNLDYEDDHNFTATVPVYLLLMSGEREDVETPAGTFASLPVRPALPEIDSSSLDDRLGFLISLGSDTLTEPGSSAQLWFSAEAGNVVRAETIAFGSRIQVVLVETTYT